MFEGMGKAVSAMGSDMKRRLDTLAARFRRNQASTTTSTSSSSSSTGGGGGIASWFTSSSTAGRGPGYTSVPLGAGGGGDVYDGISHNDDGEGGVNERRGAAAVDVRDWEPMRGGQQQQRSAYSDSPGIELAPTGAGASSLSSSTSSTGAHVPIVGVAYPAISSSGGGGGGGGGRPTVRSPVLSGVDYSAGSRAAAVPAAAAPAASSNAASGSLTTISLTGPPHAAAFAIDDDDDDQGRSSLLGGSRAHI